MLADAPIDGLLFFLYLGGPVLALAAAFFIRWRYRLSVRRLMLTRSGQNQSAIQKSDETTVGRPAGNLAIETQTPLGAAKISRPVILLALGYFIAGLMHGLTSVAIYFLVNGIEFLPVRTMIVWLVFSTPAVLSGLFALGVRLHLIVAAILVWLALPIAVAAAYGGGFAAVWQLSWLIALPIIASLLVINRMVGTIAPFLLIPAMLFLFSLLMTLDAAYYTLQTLGSTTAAYFSAFVTVLAGLAAGLVYLALVARQYSRGTASELTLQSDMLWLLVSLFHAIPHFPQHGWLALVLFAPFFAYRVTLYLLGLLFRSQHEPSRLLFLRVFGFQKRQAELHRIFLSAWRHQGPIALIGSAEIALETLEPPELFAFITGRLTNLFVSDPAIVTAKLQKLPKQTVDGLYPIEDFYCFDDTWQPAVQTLIDSSAAVLMDLRGFSRDNMGCVFEIEQLLRHGVAERLIFIVDETTDTTFLEQCIQQAWAKRGDRRTTTGEKGRAKVRLWLVADAAALRRLSGQIGASARVTAEL